MVGYGEFIKRHRLASGYKSQRRLAEKSGISAATISRIESEIQLPEVRTLQTLAHYLETTTYVELMVVCGYWDKDELLDDEDSTVYEIEKNKDKSVREDSTDYDTSKNGKELIKKIDLSDEDLLKEFNLELDGRSLTEEEARGIIAYIRSLRQM